MILQEFAPRVYTVEVPFHPLGLHVGNRMTCIQLSDQSFWVHSAISPHQDLVDHIHKLAPVNYVVAPNLFHHVHLSNFKEHFPEAQFFATQGLRKKREGFDFSGDIAEKMPYSDEIEAVFLEGMPKFNEWVFFHRASKTLILTDMLMNFHNSKGWKTKLFAYFNRCLNKLHFTWLFFLLISDRNAFQNSVEKILKWDFERIVLSHGDCVDQNAKAQFIEGLKKIV